MAANRLPVATAALTANGFSFFFYSVFSVSFFVVAAVFFIVIFHYLFIYLALLVHFRYIYACTAFLASYRAARNILISKFSGFSGLSFFFFFSG